MNIIVRKTNVICKSHPEWGTWGVAEERADYYEIRGNAGTRILWKSELSDWEIVK